jgi:FkbM family methyltransferase
MKDYSQNGEQAIILELVERFTKDFSRITVTDIGANDGITLSNSRALIELGAKGQLVEPSPRAFAKLEKLYEDNPRVRLFNCAIGKESGTATLYESGGHEEKLYGENVALLSTLSESERAKWKNETFTVVSVKCSTWPDLNIFPGQVLSIDAEGKDWEILRQIWLGQTQVLCIEYNGERVTRTLIDGYARGVYGMNRVADNGTNVIYSR